MSKLLEKAEPSFGLVINAPAVFARPDFMTWLTDAGTRVFTWHRKEDRGPHEYSDVVVLVDGHYEGDCSDMPEDIWREICDAAYAQYGGEGIPKANGYAVAVRLTNLDSEG